MSNFLTKLKKDIKKLNSDVFTLDEEDNIYAIDTYTDTGCYILNAVMSDGNIFGGLMDGTRTMLAGLPSTGKSILIVYMIKNYLETHSKSICLLFESEKSSIIKMVDDLNFSKELKKRIVIIPISTIEEFQTQFIKALDKIIEEHTVNEEPIKVMGVLDSLGMLSSASELISAEDGTHKADVGRMQKQIKSLARTVTMKIGRVKMPFLVVNHVYANIGAYGGGTKVGGGTGSQYMQDIMLLLSKSKDKNSVKEQIGNNLVITVYKHRYMKEQKKVILNLSFDDGLDRYSSIVELGQTLGIIDKIGKDYYCIDYQTEYNYVMFDESIINEKILKSYLDGIECNEKKILSLWKKSSKIKNYKYRVEKLEFAESDLQLLIQNNCLKIDKRVKMKEVKNNPEKWISDTLLAKIGTAIKKDFSFGSDELKIELEED